MTRHQAGGHMGHAPTKICFDTSETVCPVLM